MNTKSSFSNGPVIDWSGPTPHCLVCKQGWCKRVLGTIARKEDTEISIGPNKITTFKMIPMASSVYFGMKVLPKLEIIFGHHDTHIAWNINGWKDTVAIHPIDSPVKLTRLLVMESLQPYLTEWAYDNPCSCTRFNLDAAEQRLISIRATYRIMRRDTDPTWSETCWDCTTGDLLPDVTSPRQAKTNTAWTPVH